MLSQEEQEIYSRHILLEEVGMEGQLKLKNARVIVIGAGGLGCPVLQYLCAAGIGTLGICDHDTVDKSNLQRQVVFGYSSIGKYKADEVKKRLQDLNPLTQFNTYLEGVNPDNISEIITQYDLVVDCTDNYETRYLINDACILNDKPLIYGAIHKFEGQISVFNINNGPSYRCLYPEIPKAASITNCSESGVIGVLPGIIGTLQANEVIKIILGIGTTLSGKILLYSALNNQMNSFNVSKSEHEIYTVIRNNKKLDAKDYRMTCGVESINEIDPMAIGLENFMNSISEFEQIIDVRNIDEIPIIKNFATHTIPLDQLEDRFEEIDSTKKSLVFCKSGIRSRKAIEILQDRCGFKNLNNLKGGVASISNSKGDLSATLDVRSNNISTALDVQTRN